MTGRDRVLVVVEQLRRAAPGGIGTTALGLLDGLRRVGPDVSDRVDLYASRPRRGPDPLHALGYPVVTVPIPGPVLTRAWDRGRLPAPRHVSVVHAVSLAFPPPRRAALVVQVNDLLWRALPEAFPPRGRRWHEAALARALVLADRLVVPAQTVAAELVAAGADPSAIRVVPYGCDHLAPPARDAAIRMLARSGVSGPFLLSVGTLEPRKNLQRIIGAYRSIRDALPAPWPLVLVGPQGWNEQIAATEDVVLAGRVEPPVLTALYDMARLLVYVPLMEGYGLPPLEAMSRGTPVVASPLPSTGTAAYDVDPGDQDAIAAALLTVASDEHVRSALSERGRVHSASLTWAATARSMAAIWDEDDLGSRAASRGNGLGRRADRRLSGQGRDQAGRPAATRSGERAPRQVGDGESGACAC